MPGTSCGSRTTYAARLLRVPASVMSRPDWSSRTTRSASVDLVLGFGGIVGTSSRQRIQPARARCSMRCRPDASMSRNLPCRVTLSTIVPSSADSGGSKVLRALNAAMWIFAMACPSSRPLRSRARASTSGSSGTRQQS